MHGDTFDRRGFSQEWLPDERAVVRPDLRHRGPGRLKRDPRPAVPRRRRQPAVHHGQGRDAQRPLPRPLGRPATGSIRWACRSPSGSSTWRSPPTTGRPAGYVGMITANSFMKREFGKKLIEEFFPEVDLTHVIDTSGAYIPGHGTPTVILFGRNRRPVSVTRSAPCWASGASHHARRSSARAGLAVDRRPPGQRPDAERVRQRDGCGAGDIQQASLEYRRRRSGGLKERLDGGSAMKLLLLGSRCSVDRPSRCRLF